MCDAWDVGDGCTFDTRVVLSCRLFGVELEDFYDKWARAHPTQQLTHIQNFSAAMIGSNARRALKLKAAETKWFFMVLRSVLERRKASVIDAGRRVAARVPDSR